MIDPSRLDHRQYRNLTRAYRAVAEQEGFLCALAAFNPQCPGVIDYTLPRDHPYAFCVDHRIPRSAGGARDDPANFQPAHRRCNEARGDRPMPDPDPNDTYSEEWPS